MKHRLYSALRVFALGLVFAAQATQAAPKMAATQIGSRIDVTIDAKFFTSYRYSADEKYPFLFPLNGPSGASVTSMRNGQFPHHSSLFFSCDMVNGGNYWQQDLSRGQIISQGAILESATDKEVVITDVCDWKRPGAPQPFRDTRRIVISSPSNTLRQIDFDITLEALEDVYIGKTNHSLFTARMDPDLAPAYGGTLVNAGGASGESKTFGRPSPWMAGYGSRGGKTVEGLAIFQHPGNPGFPVQWFTRDYGLLSPTPFFWPADGKGTRFAKGDKIVRRYRVLVFSGTPEEAGIAKLFTKYSGDDTTSTK